MVTCYIAEVQDPTTSLFDFVDVNGTSTPGGVKTKLVGIDAGSYTPEMGLFAPDIGDGSFRTRRRAPSTEMVLQMRTTATSVDNHRLAMNRLFSLLEIPRVLVFQGEGQAEAVHIHTLGATVESLLRGGQPNWDLIERQQEDPQFDLVIQRQPIIILASDILSSVNVLTNSMLFFDQSGTNGAVDGRPDGWTWRDTAGTADATNISLESTGGTNDGYGASLATAVTRELTQDEAGAVAGQVWSAQCVVASAVTNLTITPVIYFLNGASAIIATAVGATPAVGPVTKETRLTVTSLAAPATTASVRIALRVESSTAPAKAFVLRRSQLELAAAASRFRVGPETAPNDPVLARGRNLAFWNDGEATVPVEVTVTMPAGTPNVQASIIGKRAQFGASGLRRIGDLQETRYAQAEGSERGWTVVFGTDTTAPVLAVDADASGASLGGGATNFARITHTTNPSISLKRATFTRTTKLDSLRGRFKVFGRFRPPTTPKKFGVTLKWAPAIADPAPLVETEVLVDTYSQIGSGATPTLTSGFVEVELGSVELPLASDVSIAGLTLEIWSRVIAPTPVTAANLDFDLIWLVPAEAAINEDSIGTLYLAPSAQAQVVGRELTSPPYKMPADGIWVAGVDAGNAKRLDFTLEAVGLGPNAPGTVYGVGRHRVTFTLTDTLTGVRSSKVRVTNITDNLETVVNTYSGTIPKTVILEWTGVAGKGYQPMVGIVTYGGLTANIAGYIDVLSILYEFVPVAGASQQFRSDPTDRYVAELYSSAGALLQPINASGELPFLGDRGLNFLSLRQDDLPLTYYLDRQNSIVKVPIVDFSYRPGMYQL